MSGAVSHATVLNSVLSENYEIEFSDTEQQYIKSLNELKVGYLKNMAPFQYELSGSFHGVLKEIMDIVSDDLGVSVVEKGYDNTAQMVQAIRNGEIDLIARDGDTIVFIEVKARPAGKLGAGVAAVTADKRRRLRHAADAYLSRKGLRDAPCRFDILEFSRAGIFYMENAF